MFEQYIGQDHLKKELQNLIPYNVSLMLRGASGYGKTTLARLFCQQVGIYEELSGDDVNENGLKLDSWATIHFIDEAHVIKRVEQFYPLIDSGIRFVFCSNEGINLKEPLLNRCIVRYLDHYSDEQLFNILQLNNSDLDSGVVKLIVDRCRGVPRIAVQLAFLIKANMTFTVESATEYLTDVGYYEGGFTKVDLEYIKVLEALGSASLNTINSSILGSSKEQLINEVEPFLTRKGIIRITSRGRTLCKKS